MFRKIIVNGGLKLYDKYHNIVVETIMSNPEWQEEAGKHFMEQFNSWWSPIQRGFGGGKESYLRSMTKQNEIRSCGRKTRGKSWGSPTI